MQVNDAPQVQLEPIGGLRIDEDHLGIVNISITDVDAWAELCNTHDRVAAQRSSSQLHYHLKGALNDPVHGQLAQPGRVYNGVNKEINGLCARIDPATGVPEGGKPLFPLSKDD